MLRGSESSLIGRLRTLSDVIANDATFFFRRPAVRYVATIRLCFSTVHQALQAPLMESR